MPELPEVETIRRQLHELLQGSRIIAADAHASAKFAPAAAAVGAGVQAVARRGKYLLFALDDDRELVVHLGMTGSFSVVATTGDPRIEGHIRAWWGLDDGRTLLFRDIRRFGRIAVVATGRYEELPTLHALGPEPFDPAFTPTVLWQALRSKDRHLKTQVLSQRPVAGVGNIYADEAFWRAELHPGQRRITRAQAERLHEGLLHALEQGLLAGGTTLRDYRGVDGSAGTNQLLLSCYGRSGLPCRRCGDILRRTMLDARSTTFCPRCQRR